MKVQKRISLRSLGKASLAVFAVLTLGLVGVVMNAPSAQAATSPTLAGSATYSVLGGAAVTCTGATTVFNNVGVTPGTSITGFPSTAGPCSFSGPGTENSNNASAIAAQADRLVAFGVLDAGANADANCIGGNLGVAADLTLLSPLVPGLYCATSFIMTGNLTLTGTTGVWVFKTATTIVTSPGSSVTGGDPCNVWWRVGDAATLGTTTSFIGNIVTGDVADTTALNTGATLNGRVLGGDAQTVTLNANTITAPVCTGGGGGGGGTTPGFPNTGTTSASKSAPWNIIIPSGILAALAGFYVAQKAVRSKREKS